MGATPRSFVITIVVDGSLDYLVSVDGGPQVPGYSVSARRGDHIMWTCSTPFAICFVDKTPLSQMNYVSGSSNSVADDVQKKAKSDRYGYVVGVNREANAPPLLEDPELIVEPESGSG